MTAMIITAAMAALLAPGVEASPSPLVGTWSQVGGYACVGPERRVGDAWVAQSPLRELVFTAAGRFTATYEPLESYVDYWGTWRAGPDGTLVLTVEDMNSTRGGVLDPEGRFELTPDGRLHLKEMWLGSPHEHGCGATFVRARTVGPLAPAPSTSTR